MEVASLTKYGGEIEERHRESVSICALHNRGGYNHERNYYRERRNQALDFPPSMYPVATSKVYSPSAFELPGGCKILSRKPMPHIMYQRYAVVFRLSPT